LLSRAWVRRAEQRAFQKRDGFPLADGGFSRYDAVPAGAQVWTYCANLLTRVKRGDEVPKEPEIITMIRAAKDPYAAIEPFRPDNPERAFVDPIILLQDASETSEDAL
jgi:hypothetical protein